MSRKSTPQVKPRSLTGGSLGEWIENCPSGVSPSIDQPNMLANNITFTNTWNENHEAIGSPTNAGTHTTVMLANPAAAFSQTSNWQLAPDFANNNYPSLIPPTGTGTVNQQLINSSSLALSNGTYWTYTPTSPITGVTAQVYVFCPSGAGLIYVYAVFTYTAVVSAATTNWVIPLQDSLGAQVSFGTPIVALGSCGYTWSGGSSSPNGNPLAWIVFNSVVPGSPSGSPALYSNAISSYPVAVSLIANPSTVSSSFIFVGA